MKKILILLLFLIPSIVNAGTLTIQIVETGQTTGTKIFTIPDAQLDRMVIAYQNAANVSVNGTATRLQVLNYISIQMMNGVIQYIQTFETIPAVVPAPISAN